MSQMSLLTWWIVLLFQESFLYRQYVLKYTFNYISNIFSDILFLKWPIMIKREYKFKQNEHAAIINYVSSDFLCHK